MDDPELAQQRLWFDSSMVKAKSRLRQWASTVTHSLLLTALVIVVVGAVLFWLGPPSGTNCIVRLEFAGSAKTFNVIRKACDVETAAVVASLGHDLWFIAGYAIGLWLLCMIGARAFVTGATSRAFVVAAWCAVVAGVFDLAEDALLRYGIDEALLTFPKREPGPGWTFMWAEGMALAKFVALIPALAVLVLVLVIVLGRLIVAVPLAVRAWRMLPKPSFTQFLQHLTWADLLRFFRAWTASAHRIAKRKVQVVDRGSASAVAAAWKENYRLPAGHRPETGDVTGVCLSGGGIRAATFSLGAVQSLAAAGILERAQFLSTVSGGGYFGAAYQNLRYLSDKHGSPLTTNSAFAKGTAEEDHLRRHGKYIADGTIQWVRALFVVLRNTAMSLGIVYACLVLGAWGAAYAYSAPKAWAGELFPAPESPVTMGAWAAVAIGVPLALALLTWAISGFGRFTRRSRLEKTAALLAGLAIAVAVVGVVIPVLTSWVVDHAPPSDPENSLRIGTFAAILGTATTVWNTLSKHRPESKSGSDSSPTLWSKARSKAAFAIRFLLTLAVVFGALALALVVFLAELHNAMVDVGDVVDGGDAGMHWLPIAAGVVLLLLFALFDQTRMSMHPFYKARLASAFDVRLEGGVATQPAYKHLTTLSDYGRPLGVDGKASSDPNGGLRLVLCAAAHVSGPSLAPPGRRVVPFVFSSDFIGSPKLGYLPTKSLENALTKKTYKSDITLLAASAISGAAFASSMGRASGPLDLLLALSNARLGAWLPNPRYHGLRNQKPEMLPDQDRDRTPLPKIRRLGYYAREVFGVYPANDRFVYVTDGGHYENLGLVELLRRRCKTIYCVDASGDHSMAYTLAEAAALAYEELGVTITIKGFKLAAMSAEEGKEPNADLRSLHERLSKQSVVRGTFSYPPEAGGPSAGTLIVGKATMGQDLEDQPEMFPLKSYAATQEGFPGDTTADQWFEVDQFQGYVGLGRLVGQRMSEI
jgi:hypothetical protein